MDNISINICHNNIYPFSFQLTDILAIPGVEERLKKASANSNRTTARAGIAEDLLPPFFLPKAPERNYFLFGEVKHLTHSLYCTE